MEPFWINLITLGAFIAFISDNLLQGIQIHTQKSSKDVSVIGETIRLSAVILLLVKFISLEDMYLIIGQSIMTVTLFFYYGSILYYSKYGKNAKSRKMKNHKL